jgi:endoglucanase
MNRFASFLLLAVSLSVVSALAETPVERYGQLYVDGNRLMSKKTGKPVQLRGMSFYWSMGPGGRDYYNANVVKWLAEDWKANVVRAAMGVDENWGADQKGYLNGDNSGGVSNKKRTLDVVEAAIANGIYVIIDWHSHNAGNTQQAKTFFQEMANQYKGVNNVIYEIFNEPTTTWKTVKSYSETVVSAIREIDPDNVIIIGTPSNSKDVDVASADPVNGANLVYSLHFYAASHKNELRTKARTAMNANKAIFVSEFGVCHYSGGDPVNLDETTTWLNFLDSSKVSWVNWSICKLNEAASALKSGASTSGNWTADNLTESGKYIREKLIAAYEREEAGTATLVTDLVIPNTKQTDGSAAIAPVSAQSNSFSVGPIPASKSKGGVKFFWQGRAVTGGSLFIYDALGNTVKNIRINEIAASNPSRRTIGTWDLTDAKSRRVKTGSYFVKGKVIVQNGSVANVSSIIVVGN